MTEKAGLIEPQMHRRFKLAPRKIDVARKYGAP